MSRLTAFGSDIALLGWVHACEASSASISCHRCCVYLLDNPTDTYADEDEGKNYKAGPS